MRSWNRGLPPSGTLVEVKCNGELIEVKAIYGKEGFRPHWRCVEDSRAWSISTFSKWRHVSTNNMKDKISKYVMERKPYRMHLIRTDSVRKISKTTKEDLTEVLS